MHELVQPLLKLFKEKMSGSRDTEVPEKDAKREEKITANENDATDRIKAFPNQRQPDPVAYRDKDGTIKIYEEGKAPFIWIRDDSSAARHTETSQLSGVGESYTEIPRSSSGKEAFADEEIVVPMSPVRDIVLPKKHRLPRKRRRDLMPDDFTFRDIDEHAIRAPPLTKENLTELTAYLTAIARSPVEKIRAFYVWITHNINYDTSGYFGRAQLKPTDAETVLKTRLTVCEGYCNLFEAFCRETDLPVKTISGYAKAYGCKPGDDVTKDPHNAHAWNAVFLESDWFLLDVTWGAGFVKAKEKKYVARFNNAYFLTDPEVFLTDHFPAPVRGYSNFASEKEWQLVDTKLSKEEFCKLVNFDKHGKEWEINPVSHTRAIIENIENEVDIVIQATSTDMLDYIAFMYADERKLDQFTYTYMLSEEKVNIHVCLPATGDFSLQIFGRRKKDGPRADYQPIVRYILQCTTAYESTIPYPSHHTVYGPVAEMKSYGVSEVGGAFQLAEDGEIILTVKPSRYIDILPRLHFGDFNIDLREYCFVDYSDCFKFINIILRLRYEGYYKLELLAQPEKSTVFSPFVTYLIKCTKACTDGIFPAANEHALKYKCCILEPLTKHLPPKSDIFVCIKSPVVTKIRCNGSDLEKMDDITFEGTIKTPDEDCKFSIEGCTKDEVFHTLYTYNTVIPIEL